MQQSSPPVVSGPRRSKTRGLRLALLGLAAGATGWLVVFHLFLLWKRVADLSILEPVVAGRWLGTLLLLAFGLRIARRKGGDWHQPAAFWLLVLLLHAGLPINTGAPSEIGAGSVPMLLVLPLGVVSAGALLAFFWIAARPFEAARHAAARWLVPPTPRLAVCAAPRSGLAARPPPSS